MIIDDAEGERRKERERRYQKAVEKIVIFPGSVAEYERFKGCAVEIIDTFRENKGVLINGWLIGRSNYTPKDITDYELREHLINEGVEAIVNATYSHTVQRLDDVAAGTERTDFVYYGLPVRKKKEDK